MSSLRPEETIAIGEIAHLFGSRVGNMGKDKMLKTFGASDIQGTKHEAIIELLRRFTQEGMREKIINFLIRNHNLIEQELNQLDQIMIPFNLKLENGRVIRTSPREIVYGKPRPFDAYMEIKRIMGGAKGRIHVIDGYVDESLFALYFEGIPTQVSLKIITKKINPAFELVAKKFKSQQPLFEVRQTDQIHDRIIVIDERAWVLGPSIKDAGKNPLYIIELNNSHPMIDMFDSIWLMARPVV